MMDLIPASDKSEATKTKKGGKKPDDKNQNPGLYKGSYFTYFTHLF